jgi:hypothetical protein
LTRTIDTPSSISRLTAPPAAIPSQRSRQSPSPARHKSANNCPSPRRRVGMRDSRTAAAHGDVAAGLSAARLARRLEPWASSPYSRSGCSKSTGSRCAARTGRRGTRTQPRRLARVADQGPPRDTPQRRPRGEAELNHVAALNPHSPTFIDSTGSGTQ